MCTVSLAMDLTPCSMTAMSPPKRKARLNPTPQSPDLAEIRAAKAQQALRDLPPATAKLVARLIKAGETERRLDEQRRKADEVTTGLVAACREANVSWGVIGAATQMDASNANTKYGKRIVETRTVQVLPPKSGEPAN